MTKKATSLILIALVLAGMYIYYFTDLIHPPAIQIIYQVRPAPARNKDAGFIISFTMDQPVIPNSIRVFPVSALATNKNPATLWYLVKGTNSVPIRGFYYGRNVQGMKPMVPKKRPDLLEPGVEYRLVVEAGRSVGTLDFHLGQLPDKEQKEDK
jgi:hypothetical protein